MYEVKKICLSCRHYRLRDELSGVCRVNKEGVGNYPVKLNEDSCDQWHDCGQQFYIRRGWIKARIEKGSGADIN